MGGTPFLVLNEYFCELNPRKKSVLNIFFELNPRKNPRLNNIFELNPRKNPVLNYIFEFIVFPPEFFGKDKCLYIKRGECFLLSSL